MSRTTVLVTGASGFIGSHCIVSLLENGYQVKGTIRDLSRGEQIRNFIQNHTKYADNLSFASADLMKDEGWEEAMEGCTYVLHVASPVPINLPKDENEIIKPAKEGTIRVLKAADKTGVKRVVITSSIAAICYGHSDYKKTFTEADWTNLAGKNLTAYPKSKTIAEKAAWSYLEETGSKLELVAVNPSVVLGPALEKDFGSSLELVRKIMGGELPGAPKIGWPIVDVRDVAKMQLLAMTEPKAVGKRYICANETMFIKDVAKVIKDNFPAYQNKISVRNLPNWVVRISALFDPTVKAVLSELGNPQYVSSEKAKEDLNWTCRSNEEAIISAAQSLIDHQIV